MSQREVELAIQSVQEYIYAFQPSPPRGPVNDDAPANNHETSTRYIIIDPILRALGWDLSDPRECAVEYPVLLGRSILRVDYVLLGRDGRPVVVIEAKRIDVPSDDEMGFAQMDDYLEGIPTAQVAVLTNGQYWEIGRRVGDIWVGESDKPLGLHWDDVAETASRLRKHLDKEMHRGTVSGETRGGF